MNENVLICKLCTERIESFNEFYQEIHRNQQRIEEQQATVQQKDEIRYIIYLKDNKTEIELKEVEDDEDGDIDQQLTSINIPTEEQQFIEDVSEGAVISESTISRQFKEN